MQCKRELIMCMFARQVKMDKTSPIQKVSHIHIYMHATSRKPWYGCHGFTSQSNRTRAKTCAGQDKALLNEAHCAGWITRLLVWTKGLEVMLLLSCH